MVIYDIIVGFAIFSRFGTLWRKVLTGDHIKKQVSIDTEGNTVSILEVKGSLLSHLLSPKKLILGLSSFKTLLV